MELASGAIVFEYADSFRGLGLEISPLHLPARLHGPQTFEELQGRDAFRGLPGVLADALPDAFGRRVIRAYYAARGRRWSLNPACDVTCARGGGYTRFHQMRVRDRRRGITEKDLVAVGEEFGVKNAGRIVRDVRNAVSNWEQFAARYDVPDHAVQHVRGELDDRAKVL